MVMSLVGQYPWLGPEQVFLDQQGDLTLQIEAIQNLTLIADKGCVGAVAFL